MLRQADAQAARAAQQAEAAQAARDREAREAALAREAAHAAALESRLRRAEAAKVRSRAWRQPRGLPAVTGMGTSCLASRGLLLHECSVNSSLLEEWVRAVSRVDVMQLTAGFAWQEEAQEAAAAAGAAGEAAARAAAQQETDLRARMHRAEAERDSARADAAQARRAAETEAGRAQRQREADRAILQCAGTAAWLGASRNTLHYRW